MSGIGVEALVDAVRDWAVGIHAQARLAASARIRTHPSLTSGADLGDWRDHLSLRERRLMEAAISLGVFAPPVEPEARP